MAIIREEIVLKGKQFIKTFSDEGFFIERDGKKYRDALDPIIFSEERIYSETEEKIYPNQQEQEKDEEEPINLKDCIIALDKLGVQINE